MANVIFCLSIRPVKIHKVVVVVELVAKATAVLALVLVAAKHLEN